MKELKVYEDNKTKELKVSERFDVIDVYRTSIETIDVNAGRMYITDCNKLKTLRVEADEILITRCDNLSKEMILNIKCKHIDVYNCRNIEDGIYKGAV